MTQPPVPEMNSPAALSSSEEAIYRAVTIEGRARVDVARQFQMRPHEVDQVVRRGHEALAARHAFHNARWLKTLHLYRLEHLWSETLAAWYRSREHEEIHKATQVESQPAKAELVRRTRTGDIRFLDLARRLLTEIDEVNDALVAEFERVEGVLANGGTDTVDERIVTALGFLRLVIDRRRVSEIIDPLGGRPAEKPGG